MSKKSVPRRPRRRAAKPAAAAKPASPRRARAAAVVEAPPPPLPPEPEVAALAVADPSGPLDILPAEDAPLALPDDIALATPEVEHAARGVRVMPERPWPSSRRAIFFDVENTSHVPHVERVMRQLALDRVGMRTDFVAIGNWRVIGHDIARLLSRHGAHLVHSAPATGVRDWSDLRIAVSAGVWLGTARPGDRIQVVSDDRAFDAVGDVATALGIDFQRLSYRMLSGAPAAPEPAAPAPASSARHRGRRRGRSHGRPMPAPAAAPRPAPEPRPAAAAPAAAPAPVAAAGDVEPHTAPHDEIIHVVRELVQQARGRAILIDTLARELKRRGFARTPGSPRLITRLRRIRELAVSPSGMITLIGEAGATAATASPTPTADTAAAERQDAVASDDVTQAADDVTEAAETRDVESVDEDDEAQPILPPHVQPSRHRPPEPVIEEDDDDKPGPGNEKVRAAAASAAPAHQRGPGGAQARRGPRRRRRGGRGRRPAA
jgi:hypothetical protein